MQKQSQSYYGQLNKLRLVLSFISIDNKLMILQKQLWKLNTIQKITKLIINSKSTCAIVQQTISKDDVDNWYSSIQLDIQMLCQKRSYSQRNVQ